VTHAKRVGAGDADPLLKGTAERLSDSTSKIATQASIAFHPARPRPCSPGSHPHADRPNWRRAESIDDYLSNCQEGLEEYSDRRAAKLLAVSRAELWRWKLMAKIPEDLLERLLAVRPQLSTKSLALIAQTLLGGKLDPDVERCPHCGDVLRFRRRVSAEAAKVVAHWLAEQQDGTP
jgi:hypothetical protein